MTLKKIIIIIEQGVFRLLQKKTDFFYAFLSHDIIFLKTFATLNSTYTEKKMVLYGSLFVTFCVL